DPRRGADLLLDQRHREQRRQVVGADRLPGGGVQRRLQRLGQPGQRVEPRGGDPVGRQVEAHRCIVGALTWADANPGAGAGPGPQPLGQPTCSQLDQSHWTLTSPVEGRVAEATDAYASNVAEPPGATVRTSVMP